FTTARASVSSRASCPKSGAPSKHKCTCASISPGIRVFPAPSTSTAASASRGGRVCGPVQAMVPFDTSTPASPRTIRPSNSVTLEKYVAIGSGTSAGEAGGLAERRGRRMVDAGPVAEQLVRPRRDVLRRPPVIPGQRGHRRPPLVQLDQPALDPEHLPGDAGGLVAAQERHQR